VQSDYNTKSNVYQGSGVGVRTGSYNHNQGGYSTGSGSGSYNQGGYGSGSGSYSSGNNNNVGILRQEQEVNVDGASYAYETADGTKAEERTIVKGGGDEAIAVKEGSYSYTGDDGQTYSVQYIADENGYQPKGDHLPQIPQIAVDENRSYDKSGSYNRGGSGSVGYGSSSGGSFNRQSQSVGSGSGFSSGSSGFGGSSSNFNRQSGVRTGGFNSGVSGASVGSGFSSGGSFSSGSSSGFGGGAVVRSGQSSFGSSGHHGHGIGSGAIQVQRSVSLIDNDDDSFHTF